MIRFEPDGEEIGRRVDLVVARRAGVTRTLAQRALRAGLVTVSDAPVRPSYRLEAGDVVAGALPLPETPPPSPEEISLDVVYEDEGVLVVSKPAGLVTHPARGHEAGTLVNALLGLGVPLSGSGSGRPGIVHRLDKDTSGLLLVAKNDRSADFLVGAIRARRVERAYLALVRGVPPAASGTVDAPVGRHPVRRKRMAVVPNGRPSVTHYRLRGSGFGASLLEVTLETGRTHQIRVHLAHLGAPVVGDRVYGGGGELPARLGLERPFLHAWRLRFPTATGDEHEVSDPLPADLRAALAAAGIAPPPGA